MGFRDPVRVQGYCQACEKFGQYWSCPPFVADPLESFPAWSLAVIICQQIPLQAGLGREQVLERFLEARLEFARRLEESLEGHTGHTCLIAGHCSGCPSCTRSKGEPCRCPERLRYSLEAVGFDVTGLAEGLAGQTLDWPKEGSPGYLTLVGAVLCADEEKASHILRALSAQA